MRGLGPHGERAAPADKLALTADEVTAARAGRFTTAIVLHTVTSDWARLVAAGIGETFAAHSGAVVEIVDCSFDKAIQNRELSRLAQSRIDAVISIPVGVSGLSHAYREVSKAGKKLILIDNAPAGMLPGAEYVAVVSTDNFNLGEIAAALLSPHVANEGVAGILTYSADFFAANEREIAFRKWIGANRPDLTLVRGRFAAVEDAGPHSIGSLEKILTSMRCLSLGTSQLSMRSKPSARGPAICRLRRWISAMRSPPNWRMATLSKASRRNGPYDLGVAAAITALMSLIGRHPPPWIVTPGIPVTRDNLAEAHQAIWPAPPASLY